MKLKKTIGLLSAGIILSSSVGCFAMDYDSLSGDDRYQTAINISKDGWANGSDKVILINAYSVADALAAGPYAKKINAPILLTEKDSLNSETSKEIERLNASEIVIIGGENSVSESVKIELENKNITIKRISGNDRLETSLNIAKELGLNEGSEVMVTNGYRGLADAAGAGATAAKYNMPLIFVDGSNVEKFNEIIAELAAKKAFLIGGNNSISPGYENSNAFFKRIAGENRSDTNAELLNEFYKVRDLKRAYVAADGQVNSKSLIDSVAIAGLAGREGVPVVLVNKNNGISANQNKVLKKFNIRRLIAVSGGMKNTFAKIVKDLDPSSDINDNWPDKDVPSGGGSGGSGGSSNPGQSTVQMKKDFEKVFSKAINDIISEGDLSEISYKNKNVIVPNDISAKKLSEMSTYVVDKILYMVDNEGLVSYKVTETINLADYKNDKAALKSKIQNDFLGGTGDTNKITFTITKDGKTITDNYNVMFR